MAEPDPTTNIPPYSETGIVARKIYPALSGTPYSPAWWATTSIGRVPETAVGWLVAQGWQIVSTYKEDDVTYYNMTRQSMQNWMILQSLLESYVFAYNESRDFNATRYNDLIDSWGNIVHTTRDNLDVLGDQSDNHLSIYLTNVRDLLSDLEADVSLSETELNSISGDVEAALDLMVAKLNELEGNYDTHAALTRGLLTDFGVTETARINEQFDNLLATAKQGLVNRGLYSSVLFANITTRIERERSESLTKWNDQLSREKIDHEHKLFAEQMDTKRAVIAGRTTFSAALLQKGQFVISSRNQLISMLLQGRMEKANARLGVRDREEKAMMFQVDKYNETVLGMHSFIERREDVAPDIASIGKLVAGIADSGGGWITPGG